MLTAEEAAEGCINLPTEKSEGTRWRWASGGNRYMLSRAGAAGGATMFSPVLSRGNGATPVTAAEVIHQP